LTERIGAQPTAGWSARLDAIRHVFGQVIYGMALHDIVRSNVRTRASMEHLFILITFGDLVGVPILPPYYCMRLLPFIVPEINGWRRRLLRERDLMDSIF
jgi:hypothetical protein